MSLRKTQGVRQRQARPQGVPTPSSALTTLIQENKAQPQRDIIATRTAVQQAYDKVRSDAPETKAALLALIESWTNFSQPPVGLTTQTAQYEIESTGLVPCYLVDNSESFLTARQNLSTLAKHGLLVDFSGQWYEELIEQYSGSRDRARNQIKVFTAHNQKLGFNWGNKTNMFENSPRPQFNTSQYPNFIAEGIQWLTSKLPWESRAAYVTHLTNQAVRMFSISPNNRLQGTNIPIEIAMEFGMQPGSGEYTQQALSDLSKDPFLRYLSENCNDRLCGMSNQGMHQLQRAIPNPGEFAQMNRGQVDGYVTNLVQANDKLQRLLEEREQDLNEMDEIMKGKITVDPQHMIGMFRVLPSLMQQLAQHYEVSGTKQYLRALLDPFSDAAKDARIPSLVPLATATYVDTQSVDFQVVGTQTGGRAIAIVNLTALRVAPVSVLVSSQLPSFSDAIPQYFDPAGYGNGDADSAANYSDPKSFYNVGMPNVAALRDATTLGTGLNLMDKFSSVRLVAGSAKLLKTSTSENTSGSVKGAVFRAGGKITKSIAQHVESQSSTGSDAFITYLSNVQSGTYSSSSPHNTVQFRESAPIVQMNYMPLSNDQCTEWHDPADLFTVDGRHFRGGHSLADIEADFDTYLGPMGYYGKGDNPDVTAYTRVTDIKNPIGNNSDTEFGMAASDLARAHCAVIVVDGVSLGTTVNFTLQIIRHFEGVPTDTSNRSTRRVELPSQYATPLDVLRNTQISSIVGQELSLSGHHLNGHFWNFPVFRTIKHFAQEGLNLISGPKPLLNHLLDAAPKVAELIARQVPILGNIAPEIGRAVQTVVDEIGQKMKGDNLAMHYTQDEALELVSGELAAVLALHLTRASEAQLQSARKSQYTIGYRDPTSSKTVHIEQDVEAYTRYAKAMGENMQKAFDETYKNADSYQTCKQNQQQRTCARASSLKNRGEVKDKAPSFLIKQYD